MRRSVLFAALVPCVAALAACSSSSTPSAAPSTPATAPSSAAASSAAATGGGSGSGSGNNEGLGSAEVIARYQAALGAINAAHAKGTLIQGGQSTTIDIQVNKNGTSSGTVSTGGTTIPFVGVGALGYIQYTASLETAAKIDPSSVVGKALLNKWAASNTALGDTYNQAIAPMASWSSITQLTGPSTDTYTYQGTATVNGEQVAQYKDKSASAGVPDALVSFPVSGPMLPVQMSAGGSGGLSFVWNQPTTVTAPPSADLANAQ